MVGQEVGDQVEHTRAELECEVRRRRPDEGVDVADRGSAMRAEIWLLAELEGALERPASWAFCFRTNAARSFGLRVRRKYAFRCAAICLRWRRGRPARLLHRRRAVLLAAAAGWAGDAEADRRRRRHTLASAQAAAAAVSAASRMRTTFAADRVAAAPPVSGLLGDRAASTLARMRRPLSTELMLLTTVVLWALNITVTRYVSHGFEPLAYATVRYGCATLVFLGIALLAGARSRSGAPTSASSSSRRSASG